MNQDIEFELWINQLSAVASDNDVVIGSREFWRDTFDAGLTAEDAFYYIYPECLPGEGEG